MSIRRSVAGGFVVVALAFASGCGSMGSSSSSRGGLFSRLTSRNSDADCHCSTPSGVTRGMVTSGPSMTRDTPFPGIPIISGPSLPPQNNVLPNPAPLPRGGISESGEAPRKEDPGVPKTSLPKIASPK